jgi:hypothetical protein
MFGRRGAVYAPAPRGHALVQELNDPLEFGELRIGDEHKPGDSDETPRLPAISLTIGPC